LASSIAIEGIAPVSIHIHVSVKPIIRFIFGSPLTEDWLAVTVTSMSLNQVGSIGIEIAIGIGIAPMGIIFFSISIAIPMRFPAKNPL
jgi:hypothetical protein